MARATCTFSSSDERLARAFQLLRRSYRLPARAPVLNRPLRVAIIFLRAIRSASTSEREHIARGPMRARQYLWTANAGWTGHSDGPADLCLAFGGTGPITEKWNELSRRHPGAILLGCSTGGEIHGADVLDESLSVTALGF